MQNSKLQPIFTYTGLEPTTFVPVCDIIFHCFKRWQWRQTENNNQAVDDLFLYCKNAKTSSSTIYAKSGGRRKRGTLDQILFGIWLFSLPFHFIFFLHWGNVNWECKCHSKNHFSELFTQSELAWPFSHFYVTRKREICL